MLLKDVPIYPAYLVLHDGSDKGAMEIWLMPSLEVAERVAKERQEKCDQMGIDDCIYRAYSKLPRIRVWKVHYPHGPKRE